MIDIHGLDPTTKRSVQQIISEMEQLKKDNSMLCSSLIKRGDAKYLNLDSPYTNISCGVLYPKPSAIDNGDGSVTIPNAYVNLYDNANYQGYPKRYLVPEKRLVLTNNNENYIVINYNSGKPEFQVTTNLDIINHSDITIFDSIYREDTVLHKLGWDEPASGLADKLFYRAAKKERFVRLSGLTLSETATRYIAISEGVVMNGVAVTRLYAIDSSVDETRFFYHDSGTWVDTVITQYPNTQYDNGTDLATLLPNKYGVIFVYRDISDKKHTYVVLGSESYKLDEAIAAQPPSSLPKIISIMSALVGKIIVMKNDTSATEILSVFDIQFGAVTGDYVLRDGTSELTGDWDAGSHKIISEQLESDVATGTPPLVAASTTEVENLNVEFLGGHDSSYYAKGRIAKYIRTTNQSAGLGVITKVLFNTFTTTDSSYFETSANGIKIKIAGVYDITANIAMIDIQDRERFYVRILKNTTTIAYGPNSQSYASGTVLGVSPSERLECAVDDIIYAYVVSVDAARNIYGNATQGAKLMISYLGDV